MQPLLSYFFNLTPKRMRHLTSFFANKDERASEIEKVKEGEAANGTSSHPTPEWLEQGFKKLCNIHRITLRSHFCRGRIGISHTSFSALSSKNQNEGRSLSMRP